MSFMFSFEYIFFLLYFAVPPSKPTIFDETGREVKDLVGPYLEGETIVLKCITSGGKLGLFLANFCFTLIDPHMFLFTVSDPNLLSSQ